MCIYNKKTFLFFLLMCIVGGSTYNRVNRVYANRRPVFQGKQTGNASVLPRRRQFQVAATQSIPLKRKHWPPSAPEAGRQESLGPLTARGFTKSPCSTARLSSSAALARTSRTLGRTFSVWYVLYSSWEVGKDHFRRRPHTWTFARQTTPAALRINTVKRI